MSMNKEFYDVIAELAQANDRLLLAQQRTAAARREECDATNAANEAQKKFDALATQATGTAPRDTDWYRNAKENRGQPA